MIASNNEVVFEEMRRALDAFQQQYPDYADSASIDALRATEYGRLDRSRHVYLDYTGGSLYAESQLNQHLDLLRTHVFGNPHSGNPASLAMTALVDSARAAVLAFFNASASEYVVIFTPNASGSLKLIGEAYPFCQDARYVLTYDNHNSVHGIREFARAKGATTTYVPVSTPELRIDENTLMAALTQPQLSTGANKLFAYPAQSNFSGVQHELEWIEKAQARGWDVLLDSAAYAPTNQLDLGRWKPDFVVLSFYKMFGYPTGVGCLLARKAALKKLHRPWFAGGTITIASVQADGHYLAEGEAGFEDGTINYLSLPAIEIGLKHLTQVGIEAIHSRVACLSAWLLEQLQGLQHSNGNPLMKIYGPLDIHMRGGTIALNFFDQNGKDIECHLIEEQANHAGISLRSGCFCNPGAAEIAFGYVKEEIAPYFHHDQRVTLDEFAQAMHGKAAGAVRISLGIASNFEDVYRMLQFARQFVE